MEQKLEVCYMYVWIDKNNKIQFSFFYIVIHFGIAKWIVVTNKYEDPVS